MALQIKKKFIQDGAVDGEKLLLEADQTIRKSDGSGGEIDVIQTLNDADAAEASARQAADTQIKEYKPDQVIYVSKNGDDSNSGSEQLPFLTLSAAIASITDASPTKRYAVRVSSGTYVEASISLKPNVFIVGENAKETVRIDSTVSMDASFSGSEDHRSGFANVLILKAVNFDWSSVTSAAGKLYFSQTVFGSTVDMYGHDNATAQAQFADCQIFGKLTISGINVSVFHNNLCWGAVDLNQHPNGGMATVFNAVGGTIGGELKLTTTIDDFNRRCSAFLKSCYTSQITIDGVKSYVDATNDSIPSTGASILNGGNLVQLNSTGLKTDLSNLSYPTAVNQPIMPANTNSTNMGDWGKQWNWNFAYVHASTGSDLYLISYGSSYGADSTGKSIGIIADGAGLQENVDGGNISLSTASVSGTGVRGKISLDSKEVDVNSTQIKNLADGTDGTDAVNKSQLDTVDSKVETEKARIDAILSASDADKDSFAEIVTLINSVDTENDQAFAAYVLSNDAALAKEVEDREAGDADLQAKIDAEIADRESGDQNIQSQITALQGAEGIVFEDNAAVYADGTAPVAEPSGQDGWYYKNDGQNIGSSGLDKINWYFFDGSLQTETISSALTGYAVGEIKGSEPFHLAIYTFPQGDGNDAGSWYRSRIVYVPASGSYEQGKKYLFVTNLEDTPDTLYPDLERVEIVPSQVSTVGPMDESEQILTAAIGTNSAAQPNTVEILVNNVGYVSSVNGVVNTSFEIRGDFTLAGIKESLSEEEFKRQSEDERVLSESKSYTDTKVSELVDSAPEVLDTLKELSDALGGDENFATTVANNIGQVNTKVDSETARIEGLVSDEEAARIAADDVIDGRLASLESFEYETETKVLSASDLNEIVFSKQIVEKSMVLSVGRLMLLKGIDYSLEVQPDNSTKLTFIGSVAQGGEEALAEGETLQAVFQHKV